MSISEKEVWEGARGVSGRRAFQAEPTARAKGLRQVWAATSRNRKKATWLDMSESGWMSNMCLNQEEMYFFFLKKRKPVSIISDAKQNHSEMPLQSQQEMCSWVSPYW